MRRDAPQRGPNTWGAPRFAIPIDYTREGDAIKAVRKFKPQPSEPNWPSALSGIISNHNASSSARARPRTDREVSLLSGRESSLVIEDSPLFGVIGLASVIKELRLSVNPAADHGLYAEVVGVHVFPGSRRIALNLASEQLVEERERLAYALGRFLCVETDIKAGQPHLSIADLYHPDRPEALKLATQIEQVAPAAIMLSPLQIDKYKVPN